MKHVSIYMIMIVLLLITSCNQNNSKADCNSAKDSTETAQSTPEATFETFAENFSETALFAYANVGNHKVMLVSHETFGNDQNDDKEAIDATIFTLDNKGKIMTLGSIRSQGTLYPVTLKEGKLMVGGHQFVRVYSIKGDVPELVLESFQEGESQELTKMFEDFEKGTPIIFKKSLKQQR